MTRVRALHDVRAAQDTSFGYGDWTDLLPGLGLIASVLVAIVGVMFVVLKSKWRGAGTAGFVFGLSPGAIISLPLAVLVGATKGVG
ncbi:MAG: hypothetical protein QM817_26275 [Archangium sp.]